MRKVLLSGIILLFAISGVSGKSLDKLVGGVVKVASEQCVMMEKRLNDDSMPRTFEKGQFVPSDLKWWCSGFYPGTCWYSYALGKDDAVMQTALRQTEKMMDISRLCQNHDIGFQIMCSCGLAWKFTGDKKYLPVIEDAAGKLAGRFSESVGTIRSWDKPQFSHPTIIDNMMNLELLTYAAKLFDKPQWKDIAVRHAMTTMKNHFREDGSCYHLVDYDLSSGKAVKKITVQGYDDNSAWARGQAWALYGFTMMYRETGEKDFLRHAERIAAYVIGRLKESVIPAWDFDAPDELKKTKDASAAAIMASAFIELSTLTNTPEKSKKYKAEAIEIMKALADGEYLAAPGENGNFVLKHSTGHFRRDFEKDAPVTYADYYYMEALYRYKNL